MMRRLCLRAFACALTSLAVWALPSANAQQAARVPHMVVLRTMSSPTERHLDKVFEDKLGELGWVNGRNLRIEYRDAANQTPAEISKAALEVVALKPDLIVVWATVGAVEMKKAAGTIPVVFLAVGYPVEIGLVSSLRRSGSNMTGVAFEAAVETYPKRLEILKEAVPKLSRVALLFAVGDSTTPIATEAVKVAASSLGIGVKLVGVRDASELEGAFATIARSGAQGVVIVGGALMFSHRQRIADLLLRHRLPSIFTLREYVAAGGLMCLGANLVEIARMGAFYVNKILKGANPADLPVEQPNRYELRINLKTAKALGITFPQSINYRADEVIE